MLAKLLTLVAIAGTATAVVLPAREACVNGVYRCDPTLTAVEICNNGWNLQASCAGPTCAYDPVKGVPHCYDQQ